MTEPARRLSRAFWLAVAAAVPAAARTRAPKTVFVTDTYFFRYAPKSLLRDFEGVLTIVLDHEGKPSKGLRRLVLYPRADAASTAVLDCARLEPRPLAEDEEAVSRARPADQRPMQVCGVRALGRTVDAPVDRVQLAVTAVDGKEPGAWYEIVRDPDEDDRAWIRLETREQPVLAAPVMDYQTEDEWIGSGGGLRARPYRSTGDLVLRKAPQSDAALAAGSNPVPSLDALSPSRIVKLPSLRRPDTRLRFLGIQGPWVRLEIVAPSCRGEEADDGSEDVKPSAPACPAGWVPWRDEDGEPRLFPETWIAP